MPITIVRPAPAPIPHNDAAFDEEDFDSDGDVDMEGDDLPASKLRISKKSIVTPGELVTDDPQWMRSVSPIHPSRPLPQLSK